MIIPSRRWGSSPLTRGKRSLPSRWRRPARAHPRSRGENLLMPSHMPSMKGSSPLTRGKLLQTEGHTTVAGLIPAHAGKTRSGPPGGCERPAHPRSRGENSAASFSQSQPPGSSPLTRGKRAHSLRLALQPGLIPAHAGKTPSRIGSGWNEGAHPRSRGENSSHRGPS